MPSNVPPQMLTRLDKDMAWGKAALLKDGEIPALFMIHSIEGGDRFLPLVVEFIDPEHKLMVYRFIRVLASAMEAPAVSLTSEAWATMHKATEGESKSDLINRSLARPPAEESPDRIEVLSCTLVYRDDEIGGLRRAVGRDAAIVRDKDGKIVDFKEETTGEMETPIGDVLDLMTEKPISRLIRDEAAKLINTRGGVLMRNLGIRTVEEI